MGIHGAAFSLPGMLGLPVTIAGAVWGIHWLLIVGLVLLVVVLVDQATSGRSGARVTRAADLLPGGPAAEHPAGWAFGAAAGMAAGGSAMCRGIGGESPTRAPFARAAGERQGWLAIAGGRQWAMRRARSADNRSRRGCGGGGGGVSGRYAAR